MSNYSHNNVDFDTIFEPRQVGDPVIPIVGFQDGGVDLSNIYAPAEKGTPGPNVLFLRNGNDIGPMFATLGSRITLNLEASISVVNVTNGSAVAILEVNSNGLLSKQEGNTTTDSGTDWARPLTSNIGAEYEVRLGIISGDNPTAGSDAVGVWLPLNTDRLWQLFTSNATKQLTGTLEIGRLGTSTALVSSSVFMTAHLP